MLYKLYGLCGEILEIVQYIEWNIVLLVCNSQVNNKKINADTLFAEMQAMTLGQVVGCARQTGVFDEDDLDELEYILDKRNYLAHQFFKRNDIVKHSNNESFLRNKIGELSNILSRFQNFNRWLTQKV